MWKRITMWSLWPSFIIAGIADGILFTIVNPHDLIVFGHPYEGDPMGVYTIGFFVLWLVCSLSSLLSLLNQPNFFLRLKEEKEASLTD